MDEFLQIKENHLKIEGVKGEHLFLHFSDTHAIYSDSLSSSEEIAKAKEHEKGWDVVKRDFARHFGEPFNKEHEIPSYKAFLQLMDYAKIVRPERLLLSGDIIDYLSPAALRLLKAALSEYGTDYIYVPGNHEGRYDKHSELLQFNNGSDDVGIYESDGFIIASVDDSEKTVSDKQLATLERLLTGKVPVVLLMHIPISTELNCEEMKKFDSYYVISNDTADKNAHEFLKLLTRPDSAVKAILCGHVHGYHLSYFYNGKPQICASSGLAGFVHKLTITG